MAKTLISFPSFLGTPLPPLSRHAAVPRPSRLVSTRVKFSLHELPPPVHSLDSSVEFFGAVVSRAESLLYTLADAAVAVDSATGGAASDSTTAAAQKSGGWFGFISEAMEFVLKVKIRLLPLFSLVLYLLPDNY